MYMSIIAPLQHKIPSNAKTDPEAILVEEDRFLFNPKRFQAHQLVVNRLDVGRKGPNDQAE